jgi:hypothetical protein
VDEEGTILEEVGGETRHMQARAGDGMMGAMQCELCHFRIIMKQDPDYRCRTNVELIEYIRRATLDGFWARETSTVKNNLRELMRVETISGRMGMPSITPPLRPFPLEDQCGMAVACALLDRSLDPGIHDTFVQYETFRKTRSAITNVAQVAVGGLGDSIGAYERNIMWISDVSTHSFWFTRFMAGLHKRVGDIRKQDKPITMRSLSKWIGF